MIFHLIPPQLSSGIGAQDPTFLLAVRVTALFVIVCDRTLYACTQPGRWCNIRNSIFVFAFESRPLHSMTSNAVGYAKSVLDNIIEWKKEILLRDNKSHWNFFFQMERSLALSSEYVNFLQIIPSKFEGGATLSLPSDGLNRERLFVSLLRPECDRRIGAVAKPRIK